jgi:hypothetical protein
VLVASWALTLLLDPWADEQVTDLAGRRTAAALFASGALPYRDVPFEYPPLMAPLLALTAVLGTDQDSYRLGIALVCLGLALGVLWLCARLAVLTGAGPGRAALAVALVPLLLGALTRTHLDHAPVGLALLALVLVVTGRPALGCVALGLGVMTKGFPLALAPVVLAWMLGHGQRRDAARAALALTATVAAIGLAALAISPSGAPRAVAYHVERPVQVESTPASVLLTVAALGGEAPRRVSSHGSEGLEHSFDGVASALAGGSLAAVVLLLASLALRRPEPRSLVLASATALVACAALGKVLSPQFLMWTVPLLALAAAWGMRRLAGLVALAMGLTLAEFPSRYFDLVAREPAAVAIVAARNLALVAAVGMAVEALRRSGTGAVLGYPKRQCPY